MQKLGCQPFHDVSSKDLHQFLSYLIIMQLFYISEVVTIVRNGIMVIVLTSQRRNPGLLKSSSVL